MVCLLLNFDINKSIIMSDIGAGRDVCGTLNSLLSECVWGTFDRNIEMIKRVPNDWKVCCDHPCTEPPTKDAVTFGSFLEDYTTMEKKDRTAIKTTFTNPGCIGERFRSFLQDIQLAMTIRGNSEHASDSKYYHILPSFFGLIKYLIENHINFRIVFRTFGVDIPSIAKEFNLFCQGLHPQFPLNFPVDGSHHLYPYDLRLQLPHGSGKLVRVSNDPSGVQLAYVARDQTVQVAQGFKAVDETIRKEWLGLDSIVARTPLYTVAIRDDFSWWHAANNESCTSGKLFLVDRNGSEDGSVQIFFDDNIERDRAHIVDVRDRVTFEPVSFSESVQKHFLHKVEPYCAIMDPDYFVNIVKEVIVVHPTLIRGPVKTN